MKSRFCTEHANHACELTTTEPDTELGVQAGPTQLKLPTKPVAEMILAKKNNKTVYVLPSKSYTWFLINFKIVVYSVTL